jgi:hypothetical protein
LFQSRSINIRERQRGACYRQLPSKSTPYAGTGAGHNRHTIA